MTLCKDCEHFKIRQQPIKGLDLGMAECTKYDLVVDFADKRKFKWLSCEDRPAEKGKPMRLIDADALKEELIKAKEENEKEHIVLIDNDFMTLIHDAPTVEYRCEFCGHNVLRTDKYCPNCGAKMQGEE